MNNRFGFLLGLAAVMAAVSPASSALASENTQASSNLGSASEPLESVTPSQTVAQFFPVIEFPPDSVVLQDGTFQGRGIAAGSKFSIGRQADAVLNFSNENNNFSISIAATVAEDLEMLYQGRIVRKTTGTRGINSFILETQVDSFVSSLNDYQIFDATGTCRIEVFDSLVLSSDCQVNAPAFPTELLQSGVSTQFFGMEQF